MKKFARRSRSALNSVMAIYYKHIAEQFSEAFKAPEYCKASNLRSKSEQELIKISKDENLNIQAKTKSEIIAEIYSDLRQKYRHIFYANLVATGNQVNIDSTMVEYWQTQLDK